MKTTNLLRTLATALGVAAFALPADAGVTVAFNPPAQNVVPGATVDLDLLVTPADSDFNAFDAIVEFDPGALTALALVPKSLQLGALINDACPSTFHIFKPGAANDTITVSLLCSGVSMTGPGVIYHLRWTTSLTPQATTVRMRDGSLKFYSAGLFVSPVSSDEARIGIGVDVVGVGATPGRAAPALVAAPNPSRGAVSFALAGDQPSAESLVVRDVQGRVIKRFVGPGARFTWDGRLASGNAAPNGIYFATATAGGRRTTIRFSLVR